MATPAEIKSLNPYTRISSIVLRVTGKSPLREIQTKNGPSHVVNVDLMDKHGDSIRLRAFGNQAVQIDNEVRRGMLYEFTNLRVALANPKFNAGMSSAYEFSVTDNTMLKEVTDSGEIPTFSAQNLMSLEQISNVVVDANSNDKYAGTLVNFIAVVHEVKPISSITAKSNQKSYTKRSIILVDDTNVAIEFVMFGDIATQFAEEDLAKHPVVYVQKAKVSTYMNQNQYNISFGCEMQVNPSSAKTAALKQWYDSKGKNTQFKMVGVSGSSGASREGGSSLPSVPVMLGDLAEELLAHGGKNANLLEQPLKASAVVSHIKESQSFLYRICGTGRCDGKKRLQGDSGSYSCPNCGSLDENQVAYKYILNISLQDQTGGRLVTMFHKDAERLFGMPESEFHLLDEEGRAAVTRRVRYRPVEVVCKVREDSFEKEGATETRTKVSIVSLKLPNMAETALKTMQKLEQLGF